MSLFYDHHLAEPGRSRISPRNHYFANHVKLMHDLLLKGLQILALAAHAFCDLGIMPGMMITEVLSQYLGKLLDCPAITIAC
jgi:hypothetical protein